MIAPIAAPKRITAFCKDRDMRILSASATCSGRTPIPTTYPTRWKVAPLLHSLEDQISDLPGAKRNG
jgi:hypothetical protein